MSPSRWVETTGAIGIITKNGAGGGTYAQRDIAFKFASWVSVEFELYLIKEFQRLKEQEQAQLGWSAKRELSKINYHIHTDAIKQNLIPEELSPARVSQMYANEADVLNVAMFGMTAFEWREAHPDLKGNIRDYATINELICLSNMESFYSGRYGSTRAFVEIEPDCHPTNASVGGHGRKEADKIKVTPGDSSGRYAFCLNFF